MSACIYERVGGRERGQEQRFSQGEAKTIVKTVEF